MLQQILRDMRVEPEILAELDETQKQTLFCKMREEQVRRWRVWDQKLSQEELPRPRTLSAKKSVQFLMGEDGEPWVWVMGEHDNDKSIDSILLEEERETAQRLARQEAHQLRRSVEKELTHIIDYGPMSSIEQNFELSPKSMESLEDALEIYCTAEELRERIAALEPKVQGSVREKNGINKGTLHFNFVEGKKDVLQELVGLGGGGGAGGVSGRVAAWERRVAAARATDILRSMRLHAQRRAHLEHDADADPDVDADAEADWREQERKAKEAEAQMRQIARSARREHRRSLLEHEPQPDTCAGAAHGAGGVPRDRDAIVEWWRREELPRGAHLQPGSGTGAGTEPAPAPWFHGPVLKSWRQKGDVSDPDNYRPIAITLGICKVINRSSTSIYLEGLITRAESERLLSDKEEGSFLVRISERLWGYAISYRARDRCKHYLVDASSPHRHYQFLGTGQIAHATLGELVKYHSSHVITESGGELLRTACPVAATPDILMPTPS